MAIIILLVAAAVVFMIVRNRASGGLNDPHAPTPAKPPARSPSDTSDPVADSDVISMIKSGHTIDAIRMYRELHGTDLKTAKDAVDALAKTLKP